MTSMSHQIRVICFVVWTHYPLVLALRVRTWRMISACLPWVRGAPVPREKMIRVRNVLLWIWTF